MEFDSNYPIYLQIVNEIKRQIIIGNIKPGEKLPSNSELAIMYKVNPNTVQRIYKQLEFEQLCFTKRGLGTYITEDDTIPAKLKTEEISSIVSEFLAKMKALGFSYNDTINIVRDIVANKEGE